MVETMVSRQGRYGFGGNRRAKRFGTISPERSWYTEIGTRSRTLEDAC